MLGTGKGHTSVTGPDENLNTALNHGRQRGKERTAVVAVVGECRVDRVGTFGVGDRGTDFLANTGLVDVILVRLGRVGIGRRLPNLWGSC